MCPCGHCQNSRSDEIGPDGGDYRRVTCSGLGRVAREAPTPVARDLPRAASPPPVLFPGTAEAAIAAKAGYPSVQVPACFVGGMRDRQGDARLLLWRPLHRPCLERAHSFATGLRFRAVAQVRRLPPGFLALDGACAVAIAKGRHGPRSASLRKRSGRRADPRPDGPARRSAAGCGSCSAASRCPCRCRGRDR